MRRWKAKAIKVSKVLTDTQLKLEVPKTPDLIPTYRETAAEGFYNPQEGEERKIVNK